MRATLLNKQQQHIKRQQPPPHTPQRTTAEHTHNRRVTHIVTQPHNSADRAKILVSGEECGHLSHVAQLNNNSPQDEWPRQGGVAHAHCRPQGVSAGAKHKIPLTLTGRETTREGEGERTQDQERVGKGCVSRHGRTRTAPFGSTTALFSSFDKPPTIHIHT
jgi:hypothetical protein